MFCSDYIRSFRDDNTDIGIIQHHFGVILGNRDYTGFRDIALLR